MSKPESKLLALLRRKRRAVAGLLLPALLAWVATGSACVTMTHGTPAPRAAHAAHAHDAHAAHQHVTPRPALPDSPCPHCPADGTAAVAAHACAGADTTATKVSGTPLPDVKPPPLAASWQPLPLTPAPPLIRLAASPRGAATRNVPLNILHCVLLI